MKKESGFTLVEMLIVLLVITILIILIVPNLSGRSEDVHTKGCKALVEVVQAQVDLYHLENGKYPNDLSALVKDKYIKKDQTTCQNKKSLKYSSVSGTVSEPSS
ncbi:MAG TPA: competence type IV pilus major pilin ComGC [Bacillota bacterium]|nr:competence type IV pilus major pilin ComGC [Bacillota bacterium]